MRVVWSILTVAACLSVGAGFAGVLHPAGDSLAVFRLPLAVIAALMVIWTSWRKAIRWTLTFGLMAIVGYHGMAAVSVAPSNAAQYSLYQKNLLFVSGDKTALLRDIRDSGADFVTLQEVSARNREVLNRLKREFPARHFCRFGGVGGVAVLSRLPLVEGSARCAERNGLAAMQVQGPNGPVWLISMHVHWPWPYGQAEHVDRLEPVLRALDGPKLIGGDFNTVAWSHALRRIERASGTRRVGHHVATFQLPRIEMWIGIDHVLSTDGTGAGIATRGRLGSDHRGVLAWVRL